MTHVYHTVLPATHTRTTPAVHVDMFSMSKTRNSSGDEIANVNFLYNDIVHDLPIGLLHSKA